MRALKEKHMEQDKMGEYVEHGTIGWHASDVKSLRPEWTLEQCDDWLHENSGYITDRLVELGFEVIEALLPTEIDFL